MHPVLFSFAGWRIYSYGFLVALGGILSCRLWYSKRHRMGLRGDEDFWLLLNAVLVGGFIGGRTLYIIEYVPFTWPKIWAAIFAFNKGFSVLGAFVGVVTALWTFARWRRLEFLRLLDYVSLAAPLWHVFGRLGCLAAGCCYGLPSSHCWAVRFTDRHSMVPNDLQGVALHPTQLYEAFGDMGIFLGLWFLVLPRLERGTIPPGFLAGAYFLSYGILRFVLEFWRGDTVTGLFGCTAGQILACILGAAGLGLVLWRRSSCTPS